MTESEKKASKENPDFLATQIITYIGNKRSLLSNIENEILEIQDILKKDKLSTLDLFSGSGIVSRLLKKYSKTQIANDLENYSYVINDAFLTNKNDFDEEKFDSLFAEIQKRIENEKHEGIITKNYAPKNDDKIEKDERVFYTHENALRIDTYRKLIDESCKDATIKKFFLASLITESSVHVNTSGVFKGFYKDKTTGIGCFGGKGKDAISRIKGKIELKKPVLSNFSSDVVLYKEDAVSLSEKLKNLDIAYLDPPYNQHPYGSNYFMLNLILENRIESDVSKVSGIPSGWNRSSFNRRKDALSSLEKIVSNLDSKFIIISYNSEGFISFDEMKEMLEKYGKLKTVSIKYNTFRGSRNLSARDIHVSEYLFVLKKD